MKTDQMTCERALLILIDEAGDGTSAELLAARSHVSRCPRCNAAYAPDGPAAVELRSVLRPEKDAARPLRVGLFAVAAVQLALAIPWLFGRSLLPDSHVAVSHLTRDGALGVMIAALGLVTAWRPRYVYATRLMAFVVLALQILSGLADHDTHSVTGLFEVDHLPVVLAVGFLCAIAVEMSRRATPAVEPRSPILRLLSPRG